MLETMYYMIWMVAFISFFLALLGEHQTISATQIIFLHVISVFFFFLAGVGSISVEIVTSAGVITYAGNWMFGFIGIIFAVISAGLAMRMLPEVFK